MKTASEVLNLVTCPFIFLHFPLVLFFMFVRWFLSIPLHKEGGEKR